MEENKSNDNTKEQLDASIEEMLRHSDEMVELFYDIKDLDRASVLMEGARDIRSLVKLVKVYERNLSKAMTTMMENINAVKVLSYRWGLATTVMDEKLVDAIRTLAEARKDWKDDPSGTVE